MQRAAVNFTAASFHRGFKWLPSAAAAPAASTTSPVGDLLPSAAADASRRVLSVMTFNTLSNVDRTDGAERLQLSSDHLRHHAPSVVILQEVNEPTASFEPLLRSMNYDGVYGRKSGGMADCVCVFADRAAATILQHEIMHFGGGASQVVVFALIAGPATRGERVIVVGQHAKAGRIDESEEVRLSQAQDIVRRVLELRTEWQSKYVIWGGDMNTVPPGKTTRYTPTVLPWLLSDECPLLLKCAMKDALGGEWPLFSTCKLRAGAMISETIDHIFVTRGGFEVVGYLPTPTPNPLEDMAPDYLPSSFWASDHISVMVALQVVASTDSPVGLDAAGAAESTSSGARL